MTIYKVTFTLLFALPFLSFGQTAKQFNDNGMAKATALDYKGAIEQYDKSLQVDSNNATILYNRGISKAKIIDFLGAIADYSKSINIKPDADTYFNRGLAYYKSSLNQEAINDFDKALELNPKINPQVFFEKGSANFKLKNYKEAIIDFTNAIDHNPNYAKAFFNRGIAEYNLKMQNECCLDLKKSKELGYQNADQYILKFCQ